jgi:TPR repeat protein
MRAPEYHPEYNNDGVQAAFAEKNYSWIVDYVRHFAQRGVPEAECMLGVLYQLGLGVNLNAELAEHWFLRATAEDFPIAWCNLGTLYSSGALGHIDEVEAKRCYRRAAELGGPSNAGYL